MHPPKLFKAFKADFGSISASKKHHAWSRFLQVFICLGILIAYVLGLPYAGNKEVHIRVAGHRIEWWRIMVAAAAVPAAVQVSI